MSDGTLNLANFNDKIFHIASKLDKCLILVVACGFSLNTLPQEPEANIYVETTTQLLKKLKFFVTAAEQISQLPDSELKQNYFTLIVGQVKTFLKHLSELQHAEALLMFNTLDHFLQVLAQILFRSDIYPTRVNKLAMISLYRVVNTGIYN